MTTQAIPTAQLDILETAVSAGSFKTLATALEAAGLTDALKGAGPFTVFAPTDAAFAKLPKGLINILIQPDSKDKLTAILTYHVLPARVDCRGNSSTQLSKDCERRTFADQGQSGPRSGKPEPRNLRGHLV